MDTEEFSEDSRGGGFSLPDTLTTRFESMPMLDRKFLMRNLIEYGAEGLATIWTALLKLVAAVMIFAVMLFWGCSDLYSDMINSQQFSPSSLWIAREVIHSGGVIGGGNEFTITIELAQSEASLKKNGRLPQGEIFFFDGMEEAPSSTDPVKFRWLDDSHIEVKTVGCKNVYDEVQPSAVNRKYHSCVTYHPNPDVKITVIHVAE